MKKISVKVKLNGIFIFLLWHCSSSSSVYSGSWCPYKVEKMIPCRIRNGTESYYGPNICWKSINGSHSCTKKILHRPKFVTTYKKIYDTMYKCCPGLEGSDCQNECFNCSTYQDMIVKVDKLEYEIRQVRNAQENDLYGSQSQSFVDEDVFHENLVDAEETSGIDKSLTFIALNTRISSLITEFRDMESRVRNLESEVLRLSGSLEEVTRNQPHIAKVKMDAAASYRHLAHYSSSNNVNNPHYFSSKTPKSSSITTEISAKIFNANVSIPIPAEQMQNNFVPSQATKPSIIRHLEDNLERGDIASTLNDDYGEEVLFENSTEQYIDPLLN